MNESLVSDIIPLMFTGMLEASPFLDLIMSLASGDDPSVMDQMIRYLDLPSKISSQRQNATADVASKNSSSLGGSVPDMMKLTIDPSKLTPENGQDYSEPLSPIRRFHEQTPSTSSASTSPTPAKSPLRGPL
jgi:hypothetical protein